MAMIQRRDILDKKDEAEHFWSEHFRKMLEMTAGKSEQETNSILVGLVSSMDRHNEITEGIMYGIMTDKTNALKYFQYLNLVNRDKFSCCIQRLRFLCLDRYAKLTDTARVQLLWFVNRMIDLDVRETDALFNALLRQIVTGDLTPKNIWLIHQMLDMWTNHQNWVLTQPALLPQLLYTILSVMVDHFKPGFEGVKDREVALCLQILKERGNEVKVIGRDLIRLVQQVAYYPEFDDVWRDILTNKQSPLYFPELTKMRTSRLYFQLRSQPEMESLLLFIMKQVKLGNQKRYQQWFQNKYFARVENESILPDVVRFICGCWHPPNQILSSDIVQRWVVIGWLLKSIKNQMVLTHTKRALMYDWFFFDPKSDHLMNLEPSMLLMYHSIPKYVDITSTLVEFLNNEFTVFPQFKDELKRGINGAIKVILDKGVVPTIEPIYSCQLIEPQLREAMKILFAPYVPADDQVPSTRAANADVPQPPPRPPHRPDEFKRTDSSLRSSQGPNSQVATQTQTSTAVPVTPVALAPTATVNTGNSPPAARATTPQKPPLRKSGGPPSAPPSQVSTPSPTPTTHTATNTATPAPLNISAAANTSKDVTVTTAVKPQAPAGPAAPVKQAPRTDASNDDWMAAWTSNIQKATREGGLVAPAANASPSPLTSPLLKQVATDPSPPPVPLRKSGEGKFLNAFGNMLTQLKSSQNNIANARNVLKKIISTFLQLCEHFVNDGNENVKSMTSDLAKALLDVMIEEFKESRADQLFSATHNEQTLHILLFDTYVEKKDKSVLYLIKQLRKLEPSIGYRFICYLMERNNVLQSDSHLARFDLFEKTLTAEGEDKALAHYLGQLEKRKADTNQQKVTALLPYLELLKLSKSNSSSWTPQSIFIGDCKTCAEADVLLFVDLVPHLFRFAEQAQISLKGNVDFIQAIVSSVYPAQLQHLARQLITKEVQLIGDTTKELLQSASQSLNWDSFQQYCYWQLVEAECGHHQDMLEEALPLLLAKINPLTHCEAISGLTSILRNLNPTEAMLGALLMTTLPFAPFVSTLLHSWGYQLVDEQLGVNKINRSYEFLDSIAQILSGLAKGKVNTTRTVLRHMTVWRAVDGDTCQKVIFSNKGFKKLFATAITNHKLESEFDVLFKVCASDAAPATSAAVTKKVKEEKDKTVTHKNNNGTSTKKGTTTAANSAANKKKDDKEQKNKNTRKSQRQESSAESESESGSASESDEDEQEESESSDSSGAEDFQTKKKVTGVKRRRVSSESASDSDDNSEESSEEERPKKKTSAKVEHKRKRRKVDHGT